VEPVRQDQRVAVADIGQLDVLEADPRELVGDPLGGPARVRRVLRQRRDRRDPEEVEKGFEAGLAGRVEELLDAGRGGAPRPDGSRVRNRNARPFGRAFGICGLARD
jgi:hypothetical protein